MGYYALIKNNVVTSVIVADQSFIDSVSLETLQSDIAINVSELEFRPGPGYVYNSDTGLFSAPEGG